MARRWSDILVSPDEVKKVEQIGMGSYKTCWRGWFRNEACAIVVPRQEKKGGGIPREAAALLQVEKHPCIVGLLAACVDPRSGAMQLVTELCPLGSLDVFLERQPITGRHKIAFIQSMCHGVEGLAQAGWVHGDISARNVLVAVYNTDDPDRCVLKLCDLGRAMQSGSLTDENVSNVPTRWAAVEVLTDRKLSQQSDIWSCAVCTWEVLSDGALPFASDESDEEVARAVCAGERLPRPQGCPIILWKEMQACWVAEPSMRPSASELRSRLSVVRALMEQMAQRGSSAPKPFEEQGSWRRGVVLAGRLVRAAKQEITPKPASMASVAAAVLE